MSRQESPGFINNWSLLNSGKGEKYLKTVFIKDLLFLLKNAQYFLEKIIIMKMKSGASVCVCVCYLPAFCSLCVCAPPPRKGTYPPYCSTLEPLRAEDS